MRTSYPPFTAFSTFPSTGRPRLKRVFELPRGRGPSRQLPGKHQPSRGRHDHGLNAIADGDLEIAIGVLQFVDFDRGFALAADVDERHLVANRDDGALDGLALLEALRLERSLEHRGEVFGGLGHGMLLVMVTAGRRDERVPSASPTVCNRMPSAVHCCGGAGPAVRSRCQPGCSHFPLRRTNISVRRPRIVRSAPSGLDHRLVAPVEHDDIAKPLRPRFRKRQAHESASSFTKRPRVVERLGAVRERRIVHPDADELLRQQVAERLHVAGEERPPRRFARGQHLRIDRRARCHARTRTLTSPPRAARSRTATPCLDSNRLHEHLRDRNLAGAGRGGLRFLANSRPVRTARITRRRTSVIRVLP